MNYTVKVDQYNDDNNVRINQIRVGEIVQSNVTQKYYLKSVEGLVSLNDPHDRLYKETDYSSGIWSFRRIPSGTTITLTIS